MIHKQIKSWPLQQKLVCLFTSETNEVIITWNIFVLCLYICLFRTVNFNKNFYIFGKLCLFSQEFYFGQVLKQCQFGTRISMLCSEQNGKNLFRCSGFFIHSVNYSDLHNSLGFLLVLGDWGMGSPLYFFFPVL